MIRVYVALVQSAALITEAGRARAPGRFTQTSLPCACGPSPGPLSPCWGWGQPSLLPGKAPAFNSSQSLSACLLKECD